MALASNALTMLATIKSELSITNTSQDVKLERKINEYSAMVEGLIDRSLKKADYIEKYAGNGKQLLVLRNYPVIDIQSVKVDGEEITDYEADDNLKKNGMLLRESGWPQAAYLVGIVGEPDVPKRTIEVKYTAGYILPKDETEDDPRTLPYNLENIVIELIAEDWSQQGSKGLKSFEASDVRWEWLTQAKPKVIDVIKGYKRLTV